MNKQHAFNIIKQPFFVDEINSMPLEGEVTSFFCDFQEALNLTDAQVDAREAETVLTNFECRNRKGQRVIFTIAQNATISCNELGEFTTTDIFGNPIVFTVIKATKAPTLNDVLAYHADPENFMPTHQVVLNWMEEHKKLINQFVDVSFLITDEYRPSDDDDYLLFRGDLQVDFQINNQKFDVVLPYFLAIKEVDGKLVLDRDPVDGAMCDRECFQSILNDVDGLPGDEFKAIEEKLDAAFSKYFNLSSVPSWEDRLLASFKHDDILDILKSIKKDKACV